MPGVLLLIFSHQRQMPLINLGLPKPHKLKRSGSRVSSSVANGLMILIGITQIVRGLFGGDSWYDWRG